VRDNRELMATIQHGFFVLFTIMHDIVCINKIFETLAYHTMAFCELQSGYYKVDTTLHIIQ